MVFHNLSGYDAHLFIKELGRYSRDTMGPLGGPGPDGSMKVIAKAKRITLASQVRLLLISMWIS